MLNNEAVMQGDIGTAWRGSMEWLVNEAVEVMAGFYIFIQK